MYKQLLLINKAKGVHTQQLQSVPLGEKELLTVSDKLHIVIKVFINP